MRKLFFLVLFALACAPISFAQNAERRGPEVFVGYSNLQSEGITVTDSDDPFDNDSFIEDRTGLNGINASITGYITPRFGLTGEFSFYQKGDDVRSGNIESEINVRRFNFMGGPTVKFRNESRAEPFVHALFGAANTRFEAEERTTIGSTTTTDRFEADSTDFTMALGGGLDVRVNNRIAIRAIQIDYNPVFFRDRTLDILTPTGTIRADVEGQRADNIRFSFGVVFR
jgi:opacity protein-like surface antigen